ncbi:uncharacterized protein [Arachis hypogaea]|uniref:uncharacterized protein isoform X1 n=1 Tax=Arachis hypogaea TaxID=3818 RepID=UPI000DEC724C|nr:squamosa promoter-binding-like protein 6 isoform X1 [Arachis hypogaea]
MESSWDYVTEEEKGYVSNDALSAAPPPPPSTLLRSKSSFLGWELKTPCSSFDNQCFEELGFPELLGKPLFNDLIGGSGHGGRITSSSNSTITTTTTVVDSSSGRDSLIDLKLGRFADHADVNVASFSKGAPVLCSSVSSTAPKRPRGSLGLHSQTSYCQVYGCNKDLSSSKDYHKRHKVCEVHSKTAVVIVNGIEQRFCQQCSRFHLLAEFDDGKRSCRKRLAGHNERRRKPQAGIHSGKAARLLHPCGSDSRFQGTMLSSASFISSDSDKYGMSSFWKPGKAEHGSDFWHPESRSLFPSYNGKQFPFLHESGATSTTTESIFYENNNQYKHVIAAQHPGSRPLFQNSSLGSDDFNLFDTSSTVQGLSGISDSCCALSLLSSQSQNSSSQSSGIPFVPPMISPSSHSHPCSISQVSEKIGMSSQTSSCRVYDRFPSALNPASGSQLSPILISDNNNIVNFEMADRIFQGSDFVNARDRLSCEDVATIDLLQLSSQLQRVEHQRQSLQVKQENDSSCTLRIT